VRPADFQLHLAPRICHSGSYLHSHNSLLTPNVASFNVYLHRLYRLCCSAVQGFISTNLRTAKDDKWRHNVIGTTLSPTAFQTAVVGIFHTSRIWPTNSLIRKLQHIKLISGVGSKCTSLLQVRSSLSLRYFCSAKIFENPTKPSNTAIMSGSRLFQPLKVGSIELKNRVAMAPLTR
jgi:hypothetical protein